MSIINFSQRWISTNCVRLETKNKLQFQDCTLKRNRAYTGSTVDLNPSGYRIVSNRYRPETVFQEHRFVSNQVFPNSNRIRHKAPQMALYTENQIKPNKKFVVIVTCI